MKIETSLLNAVRFPVDDTTVLHLHTGDVDPKSPTVVKPAIGPKVYLRQSTSSDLLPLIDAATPYGAGADSLTSFQFRKDEYKNYLTTAKSESPVLPAALDLQDAFRLSLFLRLDEADTGGELALIAGVPGRFELVQQDLSLLLRLKNGGVWVWVECELNNVLEVGAWHLLEVQWDKDRNSGEPIWYVNGQRCANLLGSLESPLDAAGDRFDVRWPTTPRMLLEAVDDGPTTDTWMYARAMQLFGLATSFPDDH